VSLLQVEDLEAGYGLLKAVRGISFSVEEGERIALVGANGAGKTTLLRCLAGAHQPSAGRVSFDGADVTSAPAYKRVASGVAMVPEGRRLFQALTVRENLQVAAENGRPGPWDVARVTEAFPMLEPLLDRRASTLSGGQQQAAAIARSLMTNPRLLLLDEVSLGLSPVAVQSVYDSLEGLDRSRATLILVEQDLTRALAFADRVLCMLEGRVVLEGAANSLTREQVTQAYFGLRQAAGGS